MELGSILTQLLCCRTSSGAESLIIDDSGLRHCEADDYRLIQGRPAHLTVTTGSITAGQPKTRRDTTWGLSAVQPETHKGIIVYVLRLRRLISAASGKQVNENKTAMPTLIPTLAPEVRRAVVAHHLTRLNRTLDTALLLPWPFLPDKGTGSSVKHCVRCGIYAPPNSPPCRGVEGRAL